MSNIVEECLFLGRTYTGYWFGPNGCIVRLVYHA